MTYIIAEIGVNHNGDIEIAKKLVDAAVYAKANAAKFQTFESGPNFKCNNITYEETKEIKNYCKKKGIDFLSAPHSIDAIDFLDDLVDRYKLASPFIVNIDFVYKMNEKKKPVIMSTGSIEHRDGMATLAEINNAINWLKDCDVTLLHCVSKYPCEDSHLERIRLLKEEFKLDIGLSDHSQEFYYSEKYPIIEKHLTLSKSFECPDKCVSITPQEFRNMVENIRTL